MKSFRRPHERFTRPMTRDELVRYFAALLRDLADLPLQDQAESLADVALELELPRRRV